MIPLPEEPPQASVVPPNIQVPNMEALRQRKTRTLRNTRVHFMRQKHNTYFILLSIYKKDRNGSGNTQPALVL